MLEDLVAVGWHAPVFHGTRLFQGSARARHQSLRGSSGVPHGGWQLGPPGNARGRPSRESRQPVGDRPGGSHPDLVASRGGQTSPGPISPSPTGLQGASTTHLTVSDSDLSRRRLMRSNSRWSPSMSARGRDAPNLPASTSSRVSGQHRPERPTARPAWEIGCGQSSSRSRQSKRRRGEPGPCAESARHDGRLSLVSKSHAQRAGSRGRT